MNHYAPLWSETSKRHSMLNMDMDTTKHFWENMLNLNTDMNICGAKQIRALRYIPINCQMIAFILQ